MRLSLLFAVIAASSMIRVISATVYAMSWSPKAADEPPFLV